MKKYVDPVQRVRALKVALLVFLAVCILVLAMGLFYTPNGGFSIGGFHGGRLFLGGPTASFNLPGSPTSKPSGVFGANASVNVGPWFSNAGSPSQLGGSFDQVNPNMGQFSGYYSYSGNTSMLMLGVGDGEVASFSTYPTHFLQAGGFNLSTGQPDVYVPSP